MSSLRPFGDFAASYAEHGLVTFPVGGRTGKKPLVQHWQSFGPNTYQKLTDKYASENIGIRNDDKLTIVDIDDENLYHRAIDRFGYTPFIVRTPSGGWHFWYKSSGEKRIIKLDGQKIDILGRGGFAVAPPSRKPSGGQYTFIENSEYDLDKLPPLKPGSLSKVYDTDLSSEETGQRNTKLFACCRSVAPKCPTENKLIELTLMYNQDLETPLPENEVLRMVANVWKYKLDGKLINPGDNKLLMDMSLFELTGTPDAFTLALFLIRFHGARTTPFAISGPDVAELLDWTDKRTVYAARDILLKKPLIKYVGKGGARNRANQYVWV